MYEAEFPSEPERIHTNQQSMEDSLNEHLYYPLPYSWITVSHENSITSQDHVLATVPGL